MIELTNNFDGGIGMSKVLNNAFDPLNAMTEHLELANRMTEIFNTQNHISEIVNSCIPPVVSCCDSLVSYLALLQSNL